MNFGNFRRPQILLPALLALLVFVWVAFILPWEARFRWRLQHLNAAEVQAITLCKMLPVDGLPPPETIKLTESECREFLGLLASARLISPNHPKGGWSCFARIWITNTHYLLPIWATSNNGTFVALNSGGTDGWNMGRLRNDALQPFVEQAFSNHTATVFPPRP